MSAPPSALTYEQAVSMRHVRLAQAVLQTPGHYPYIVRQYAKLTADSDRRRHDNTLFLLKNQEWVRRLRRAMVGLRGTASTRNRQARATIAKETSAQFAMEVSNALQRLKSYKFDAAVSGQRLRALLQLFTYPDLVLVHRYLENALAQQRDPALESVAFLRQLDGAWVSEVLCWRLVLSQLPELAERPLSEQLTFKP